MPDPIFFFFFYSAGVNRNNNAKRPIASYVSVVFTFKKPIDENNGQSQRNRINF